MEQFGLYVQELQGQLQAVRAEHEGDRRQLLEVRTLLQQSNHHLDAKEVRQRGSAGGGGRRW